MKTVYVVLLMLAFCLPVMADQENRARLDPEVYAMGPPQEHKLERFVVGPTIDLGMFGWYGNPENFYCFSLNCMTSEENK